MSNSKSNSFLSWCTHKILRVEWITFLQPFPGSGTSYSKAITGDCLSKETKTEETIAIIMINYNSMIPFNLHIRSSPNGECHWSSLPKPIRYFGPIQNSCPAFARMKLCSEFYFYIPDFNRTLETIHLWHICSNKTCIFQKSLRS